MVQEITIKKGNYQVTLFSTKIAENYTNKLELVPNVQVKAAQENGTKTVKVVDHLVIAHQFVIQCYITGSSTTETSPAKLNDVAQNLTAKEVKDYLKIIYNGGGINGGLTTMVYDGDSYSGFLEKVNFVEVSADDPSEAIKDYARYEIAVTFVEGENA